jgi:hypothetical protein
MSCCPATTTVRPARSIQDPDHCGRAGTVDADKNGEISREETAANAALSAGFDKLDLSGDGALQRTEVEILVALNKSAIEDGSCDTPSSLGGTPRPTGWAWRTSLGPRLV